MSSEKFDIETKIIVIEKTDNILDIDSPLINTPFIFPLFTYQHLHRAVHLEYRFTDIGIIMKSNLTGFGAEDIIYQPSLFEKKLYNYLLIIHENKIKQGISSKFIDFDLADFVENFLENKMNSKYYHKVEQALKNLKYTQYEFIDENPKSSAKLNFKRSKFNLIDYSKIKKGKQILYKVSINPIAGTDSTEKEFKKIIKKDSVAERIYEFILINKSSSNKRTENIKNLANIIPLQTFKINKKIDKYGSITNYKTSNMSFVNKRIQKAFETLVELEQLKSFEMNPTAEGTINIDYLFTSDSENIRIIPKQIIKEPVPKVLEFESKISDENVLYEELDKELEKAKRNIFFSKKYKEKDYNLFVQLCKENNESFVIEILKRVYKGLTKDIKKTLSAYVHAVVINYRKELVSLNDLKNNTPKIVIKNEEPELAKPDVIPESTKKIEPKLQDALMEVYMNFSKDKKIEVEENAKILYEEDIGIPLNPVNLKIFNNENIKKLYIRRVLKEMFAL